MITNGKINIDYKSYEIYYMAQDIDHIIDNISKNDHLDSLVDINTFTKESRYIFKINKVYKIVNTKELTASICELSNDKIRIRTCYRYYQTQQNIEDMIKNKKNIRTKKGDKIGVSEQVLIQPLQALVDKGIYSYSQAMDIQTLKGAKLVKGGKK